MQRGAQSEGNMLPKRGRTALGASTSFGRITGTPKVGPAATKL